MHHLQSESTSHYLWIDAVCIHQDDNRERAQQVQLMRSIYQKASRVLKDMKYHRIHRNQSRIFLDKFKHADYLSHKDYLLSHLLHAAYIKNTTDFHNKVFSLLEMTSFKKWESFCFNSLNVCSDMQEFDLNQIFFWILSWRNLSQISSLNWFSRYHINLDWCSVQLAAESDDISILQLRETVTDSVSVMSLLKNRIQRFTKVSCYFILFSFQVVLWSYSKMLIILFSQKSHQPNVLLWLFTISL